MALHPLRAVFLRPCLHGERRFEPERRDLRAAERRVEDDERRDLRAAERRFEDDERRDLREAERRLDDLEQRFLLFLSCAA